MMPKRLLWQIASRGLPVPKVSVLVRALEQGAVHIAAVL